MPKAKTKERATTAADAGLAARVEKLEQELRELKEMLQLKGNAGEPGPDDWKKSIGIFKDDPTFDEAIRLGHAWRRRQRKW